MDNILEIKNVSKRIGKKKILKDISLEVKEGEIFGFVGPNGAGKTTLIKTMLGLYKQDSGTIKIGGYDINKDFEKAMENIGAIIENPEMYDYLSGKDNLSLYSKIGKSADDEYHKKIVKTVKLEDRINSKVKTYSLGMRQRLGVAQALIGKPKLLVLDEPTNGLDPLGIKELRELLKTISKENNIAVFVSSHILSEIELMCDRIAIIDNGEIIEVKDLNNRQTDKEDISILIEVNEIEKAKDYLKENNFASEIKQDKLQISTTKENIPIINKILVENNIKVYEIKQTFKTLEDEFIEKTKGTKGQIK
ncbi:MAG: ABC transporter ATP-binding protein [Bacilli bacterium]